MSSLRYSLAEQGLQLQCEPREGFNGYYARVAPYLDRGHYGAPTLPFYRLISGAYPGYWGLDAEASAELDSMVITISKERLSMEREYNGAVVICIRAHRGGDQLQLSLAPSNYVSVLAAQALGYGERFQMLSVNTALISSDGQLCLTQRSAAVSTMPGRLNTTSSGIVEPPKSPLRPTIDLQKEALRETLSEVSAELALTAEAIAPRSFGITNLDDDCSAALLLEADVPITFDELVALHTSSPPREAWETESFIGLPLDDLASIGWVRSRQDQMTPTGLASALLALARAHGESALEAAWQAALPA
jgi:hypothetical protein